ncbi:hypothetical protein M0R45_016394 [Rubus argutus]|uniref:Uncharacterized protein n=1 Tax=Rubus argutus TaxID=59490 RepID=A0AAW1XUX4_RUBAR
MYKMIEVEENVDDYKHDLVVSKKSLDTMSDYTDNGEIGSKDKREVTVSDGTPMTCELQAKPEKKVDGSNEDLSLFGSPN